MGYYNVRDCLAKAPTREGERMPTENHHSLKATMVARP